MYLVVGSTGMLGGEICRVLGVEKKKFKALIRSTSDKNKVEQLALNGAELVYGDLKNPHTLDIACQDVTTVISTASSTFSSQEGDSIQTVDLEGQINLIEAAKLAGVKQFIFISYRNNTQVQYPLTQAKRKVENHLKNSGLNYTILQAGYFMEVWLSAALGFDYQNYIARIYGDGTNKMSWISFKDVAKFAIVSINNPNVANKIVEVGGPQVLSPLEVVRIFEEATGNTFSVENIDEETLRSQMENSPDPLLQSFNGLMLQYAKGDEIDITKTKNLIPDKLFSVRDYAKKVLEITKV